MDSRVEVRGMIKGNRSISGGSLEVFMPQKQRAVDCLGLCGVVSPEAVLLPDFYDL